MEWLQHGYGLQSSVSLSTAKRLDSALEKFTIEIRGLTFPASSGKDDARQKGHAVRNTHPAATAGKTGSNSSRC